MKKTSLIFLAFGLLATVSAQTDQSKAVPPLSPADGPLPTNHLTLYLIPAKAKYDWSSPNTLYRSYMRNFILNIFKKEKYLLGHAFLEVGSEQNPGVIMTGMRSTNRDQQKELVMEENIGLAILGTGLEGRLQVNSELEEQVDKYARKGKLAFIRFMVSDAAAEKMIEFYDAYSRRLDSIGLQSCYGGAYWPRYYGEGSGCSAYAMCFLEVAGLLMEEFAEWKIDINIPMALIGGPYNQGREVEFKDIKKCMHWSAEPEKPKVDYEPFWIYDPSVMYDWVLDKFESPETLDGMEIETLKYRKARGLEIDARHMPVPDEAMFISRNEPSLFIDDSPGRNETGK